jgi:hypothetical protein
MHGRTSDGCRSAVFRAVIADYPHPALSHPVRLRRAGKEVRIVIDNTDPFAPRAKLDPSLVRAIAKAHHFNEKLLHGRVEKFADLAKSENLQPNSPPRVLGPGHHRRHS